MQTFGDLLRQDLQTYAESPLIDMPLGWLIKHHHAIMEDKGFHDLPGMVIDKPMPTMTELVSLAPAIEALGELTADIRVGGDHTDALARLGIALEDIDEDGLALYAQKYIRGYREDAETPLATSKTAIAARLVLIVSEIAEALEALRVGDWVGFLKEMADIQLRWAATVGEFGRHPDLQNVNMTQIIAQKMLYNMDRPPMHGKKA
jgi:hypothetical protein